MCAAGKRDPGERDNVCAGRADWYRRWHPRRHLHHSQHQDGARPSTRPEPTAARRRAEDSAILRAAFHSRK